MSELPKGWVNTTIGDVVDLNPKLSPEFSKDSSVSFVPMAGIDEDLGAIIQKVDRPLLEVWKGYTHFKEEDVLFAKITPCMENGKVAVARELTGRIGCGSTEFHVLRSSDAVEPDLLWRYLRQAEFRKRAERSMTGAVGQRRVPTEFLRSESFALPPLAEQRRIVAKIDSLSARSKRAREELIRVPALIDRLKALILDEAFSGELTSSFRQRYNLRPWGKTLLVDLICDGPSNGWSPPSSDDATGALTLKLTATTSGRLRLDTKAVKRIHETPDPTSKYWLSPGDILIQRANTLEYVGMSAVFDGPRWTYIYPDLMMRIRAADPGTTRFLWMYLNAPESKAYFKSKATGTAGNMPKINGETVRKLSVPTMSEQERDEIVRRIEQAFAAIDRLAVEAQSARSLLDKLDQAILAKAFRGELVPQDPNDETASVLLERIRAERAAAPAKSSPRTRGKKPTAKS